MILGVAQLTASDFEALGLYDPAERHAPQRLELLQYLVSVGATAEDLLAYHDDLAGLPSVVAIRAGRALTVSEVAASAGVEEEKLLRISRAAGFAEPGPEDRVFTEQFAGLAAGLAAAEELFGEQAMVQLVRVMGATMARLADAIVSAFLVNVEPRLSEDDPARLEVARANAHASALLPTVNAGLDILLRQHLLAVRRSSLGMHAEAGYETRSMCIGFADLVGSTALAQRKSAGELGAVLSEFERMVADIVISAGGRVVKMIGDEVLFTTGDLSSACSIALQLAERCADHPNLPLVRAGLAAGEVTMRDGDVFGPVVNLAARAVKVAAPGEVMVPSALAAAAGLACEPAGTSELKGFDSEVPLCRLLARGQPPARVYGPSQG
jgi:adenylate cyclase